MTKPTVFRKSNPGDRRELEGMIFSLYSEDEGSEKMSPEKIERTLNALTQNPEKGAVTVFEIDSTVVGYAITIFFWSNEYGGDIVVIDELYVKPDWRGKGIGKGFIDSAAHMAHRDIVGLQLEVTPTNRRAFDYYRRLGFETSPNRQLFRRTHACVR